MCVSCDGRPTADVTVQPDGSVLVAEHKGGPAYLATPKHRAGAGASYTPGPPNKWLATIKPDAQRRIFSVGHSKAYVDSNGTFWGACVGLPQLGLGKYQRYAKFLAPKNTGEPFHGYPVSATDPKRTIEHKPPAEILTAWTSSGVLPKRDALLILKGKL